MELDNLRKQKTPKREKNLGGSGSQKSVERKLRQRERKHYTEDCINDEEIEGKRMFSVEEKLLSGRFNANFVQEMSGDDLNIGYFQEHGFLYPIVIKEKSGLGMRLPNANFSVHDVRQCVGSRRVLDVMDVTTQRDIEMTMRDWVKYYDNPQRDKLLNVISLEFSHTKLDNIIESPSLVREIDWVNRVWPQHLKDSQLEATNSIEDMRYPKVQKYCLMSVRGCYTDFHIDFGGTSVWYHILRGRKVFWLIPPTEMNVQLYEQWVLSGKQSDIFFGDTVDECGRIELDEGWTFFIPTGWIHAVYTPADSLVFGGNFLHSFGIEKQLRIAQVEDATRVPPKFRYPFYTEMLWFVLDRYVHCLIGRSHVDWSGTDEIAKDSSLSSAVDAPPPSSARHDHSQNGGVDESSAVSLSTANSQMKLTTTSSPREPLWGDRSHASDVGRSSPDGSDSDGPMLLMPLASPRDSIATNNSSDVEGKENKWAMFGDWSLRSAADDENYNDDGVVVAAAAHDGEYASKRTALSPSPSSSVGANVNSESGGQKDDHVHLTRREISGLKAIAIWLSHLSSSKRNVPSLIKDPVALLSDVKILLGRHKNDDPLLAITGKPVLNWNNVTKIASSLAMIHREAKVCTVAPLVLKTVNMMTTITSGAPMPLATVATAPPPLPLPPPQPPAKPSRSSASSRRRRTRCKKCDACVRSDCGDCHFCKDMKKFGGPGRMKQSCMARQCTAPILPHTACCMICGRDGWRKPGIDGGGGGGNDDVGDEDDDQFSTLMECSICWEIVHPECLDKPSAGIGIGGIGGDDAMPNSWECPKCSRNTKGGPAPKLRQVKPGQRPNPKGGSRHTRDTTQTHVESTPGAAKSMCPIKRKDYSLFIANPWKKVKCAADSSDEDESNTSSQSDGETTTTNRIKMPKARPAKSQSHAKRRDGGTYVRSCAQQQPMMMMMSSAAAAPNLPSTRAQMLMASQLNLAECNRANFSTPSIGHAMDLSRPCSVVLGVDAFDEVDKMQKLKLRMLGLKSPPPPPPLPLPLPSPIVTAAQRSASTEVQTLDEKNGLFNYKTRFLDPLVFTAQSNAAATAAAAAAATELTAGIEGHLKSASGNSSYMLPARTTTTMTTPLPPHGPQPVNNNKDGVKLKKPMFVVRPAPILESKVHAAAAAATTMARSDFAMDRTTMVSVFRHLEPADLVRCMLVCRAWNRWCLDRDFWSTIELAEKRISTGHLAGIVRRQPAHLGLRSTNISKKLLGWLVVRLPQLRRLDLARCGWTSVSGLVTCNCPTLQALDVSASDGLNDARLRELLAPPMDSRPGLLESKSRLRNLVELRLSGCDVSDVALRYLTQYLPRLARLDLSGCEKVSDAGVALLSGAGSSLRESLARLDAPRCARLTDNSLDYLKRCPLLVRIDLRDCPSVSVVACRRFIAQGQQPLMMAETKLIEKQKLGFNHQPS